MTTESGVTLSLSVAGPTPQVLAYLPAGISLGDAAKIAKVLHRAFPGATAMTAGLPAGMAMAIMRPRPTT